MIEVLKEEKNPYVSDFRKQEEPLLQNQPAWLQQLRRGALDRFSTLGFPTIKEEAWRFTNLSSLARQRFQSPTPGVNGVSNSDLAAVRFVDMNAPRLVFVNGSFSPKLSSSRQELPEGVTASDMVSLLQSDPDLLKPHLGQYALHDDQSLIALNTAFSRDGAYLHVAAGQNVEEPLHLLFLTTGEEGRRIHPRTLIQVEDNSQVTIVESYIGLDNNVYLSNPVTEVIVGNNSQVDHYRLQNEGKKSFHLGINEVVQGRDSRYVTHAIDLGAVLTRNDLTCILNGEGGLAGLNGLYLLNRNQHVDNFTTLDHAKPHCDSREMFKGILDDKASGVFRGRIIVRKDAQKTDSKQTNKNLLLSDNALVNTKPQLEIYADDVKCTHGATIGQLDATALFYLRSRGISEKAARSLLVFAFASEVVENIQVPALREQLIQYLTNWLPKGELIAEVYQR